MPSMYTKHRLAVADTTASRACTNTGCGCDNKGGCGKTCLDSSGNTKQMAAGATCYKECSDGSFVPTTGTCTPCTGNDWKCCSAPPCNQQPWDINIFTTYPDPI